MKIQFVKKLNLGKPNIARLLQINDVLEDYAAQGYSLTLRQLYYQLVSKNIIANKPEEYDKLGNLLTKGRMAGYVSFSAIEDRVRVPRHTYEVDDIPDAIGDVEKLYRLDRQKGQTNYIELWVEKDAISNILSRKTNYYHIRMMVNRGYSSTTAMFDAYERILSQLALGKFVNILYVGDHDPSGLHISEKDLFNRLFLMLSVRPTNKVFEVINALPEEEIDALLDKYEDNELSRDEDDYVDSSRCFMLERFKIKPIALTWEQIKLYNPPINPVKIKDPRAAWYVKNYGEYCWEVDALTPQVFHETIDKAILDLIDIEKFNVVVEQEKKDKEELKLLPSIRLDYPIVKQAFEELEESHETALIEIDNNRNVIDDLEEKVDAYNKDITKFEGEIISLSKKHGNALTLIQKSKIDKKLQEQLLTILS